MYGFRASLVNKKLTFSAYNRIGGRVPRARTFYNLLRSIQNFRHAVLFTRKLLSSISKLRPRSANCGAILIEFAVCMPILIILLFYINDLMRIKRYYAQTEFVAQQMANIIQNISQKRSDKRIYLPDLRKAFALAWQTVYPGKTLFKTGSGWPLAHIPHMMVYFVTKDNDSNTASVKWKVRLMTYAQTEPPSNIYASEFSSDHGSSTVRYKTGVSSNQIYPSLKIDTEPKILIEASCLTRYADYENNENNQKIPLKQAFGLHLIKPRRNNCSWYMHFNSVIIFTPKPGLFTNDHPT